MSYMTIRLEELGAAFSTAKLVGVKGEQLANETIGILNSIDSLLTEFAKLQEDPELMDALANAAGGNQMEYSTAVAGILAKAKADIAGL